MSTLDLMLAFTGPLLFVILLLRLHRDGYLVRASFFTAFLTMLTARFCFLIFVYFTQSYSAYYAWSWRLKPIEYLFGMALAVTLVGHTIKRFKDVMIFYAAAALLTIVATMLIEFDFVPMLQGVVVYDLLRVYLLLMVLIFGDRWAHPYRGIAIGFGVAAIADLGCTFLRMWIGDAHCLAVQRLYQVGFISALVVWFWNLVGLATQPTYKQRKLQDLLDLPVEGWLP